LHDYGKIGVRDEVLCKPSSLTAEEYEEIKQHPAYTLSILSKIKFSEGLAEVPHVASCHHERPDGKGYPRGLRRAEIPIGALIIAVADVFDALTVKRHYRDPMPLDEVLALLEAGRDTQFEGTVIDAFKLFYYEEYLPRQTRYRT
jgi:HD-GYP domain-containing protein (c-di-GMP phosphodiesterase class II)